MNNNCDTCKFPHGTLIDYVNGGLCKECGTRNRVPLAVYAHDWVDGDDVYWHHIKFQHLAVCKVCGHSAIETDIKCKDLNHLKVEQTKPEMQTA